MTRLGGIALRIVESDWADEVASPPHDALTPAQRRAHLAAHPRSYLGVTRGMEDVAPGITMTPAELLDAGKVALEELLQCGAFGDERAEAFYAYRLEDSEHSQTGIICAIPADGLRTGELRAHEDVHGARRDHLAGHLTVVGHQSSPVVVSHRSDPVVTRALENATEREPLLDHTSSDGLRQTIWLMTGPEADAVIEALAEDALYVIDGHHRTGAALSHFDAVGGEGGGAWLLGAIFPSDEMRNLAHHRVWAGDPMALTHRLGELGARKVERSEVEGRSAAEIAVYVDGGWYLLRLPIDSEASPVERLEPSRLQAQLLDALGGSVSYRPGSAPISELAVALEPNEALFVLRPITMLELFEVADAGQHMPPKSTYFSPKARSGVVVRSVT